MKELEEYLKSRLMTLRQSESLIKTRLARETLPYEEYKALNDELICIPKLIQEVKTMLAKITLLKWQERGATG